MPIDPQTWFYYECHDQPCASRHDGVCLDLRVRGKAPPAVRCPLCGGAMTFAASEVADADGYRPSSRVRLE